MNDKKNVIVLAVLTVFLIISIVCNFTFYQKLQTSNAMLNEINYELQTIAE